MTTRIRLVLTAGFWLAASPALAQNVLPASSREGEIPTRPPVTLVGSDLSQRWQNWRADQEGILPLLDPRDRAKKIAEGDLVSLAVVPHIQIDSRMQPPEKAYVWTWVAERISALAAEFHAKFGKILQVNSAHRTLAEQAALRQTKRIKVGGKWRDVPLNANAAHIEGPKASLHLRGIAIDLSKITLKKEEQEFLEELMLREEERGCADGTREGAAQSVYHLTLFPTCTKGYVVAGGTK